MELFMGFVFSDMKNQRKTPKNVGVFFVASSLSGLFLTQTPKSITLMKRRDILINIYIAINIIFIAVMSFYLLTNIPF